MKPAEITEAVLKNRIKDGLQAACPPADKTKWDETIQRIFDGGNFKDFVGIVGKATDVERLRAGHTARRLGHPQTGRVIMDGK